MIIDREVQSILGDISDEMKRLEHPPLHTVTPEQSRYFNKAAINYYSQSDHEGIIVEDKVIVTAGIEIPIRLYTPVTNEHLPILVFFHGGGWVFGDLDSCDFLCSYICKQSKCIVVSVSYKKSPEFKYPTAINEACLSYQWVKENFKSLNGNGVICIGGESSGGNLAAGATLKLRDEKKIKPHCQVLITPVLNHNFETRSYNIGFNYNLTKEKMQWFWNHYLEHPIQGKETYASPLLGTVNDLPNTLIYTAELDPLRDEGEAYATYLKQNNITVIDQCFNRVPHAFPHMARKAKICKKYLDIICQDIYNTIHLYRNK